LNKGKVEVQLHSFLTSTLD